MRSYNISKIDDGIKLSHHIIFWGVYFTFNVLRWGSYYDNFFYSIKSNLVEFPIHIVLVYFNIYYLIPRFILKRKFLYYLILLFLGLTVMYYVKVFLTYNLVNTDVWPEAIEGIKSKNLLHYVTVVLGELYVIGLTSAIKLTYDRIKSRKRNEDLVRLNLETEIKYLRAQIQPHFFFNTLNNLYALTISKSDKAPEVIIKLSELMQYVLYEAKEDKTAFRKEINYIESYLELEKLRFGERLKANIEISGSIENLYIPPLIFLPLIENCFKHGVSYYEGDINIDIKFDTNDEMLIFETINPVPERTETRFKQENKGIGIENIKKRLELNFGKEYSLEMSNKEGLYSVKLAFPKS